MAAIPLLRVDNRLIHGQVTAFWVRSLSCDHAIIIDDATATETFIKKILKMAMPPSTKLTIYSVEDAVKEWKENQLGKGRAMVIFKDIAGAKKTFDAGFRFETLQIGGSARTTGQKQVHGPIYMNEDEAKILNELDSEGVEITIQVLSEQKPIAWKNICQKAFPDLKIRRPQAEKTKENQTKPEEELRIK